MVNKFFDKSGEAKNIAPKIFAIILAIVLWLYVMNEQNPPIESSFSIPLEVRNAATSYVINDVPDTVRIKIRGPRSIVAGVLNGDLRAYIDVKGLGEGRHTVKVVAAVPSSLELVEITPDKLPLVIDATVSKQLPVEVRVDGAPAKGILTGKVAAANQQVTLEGPKSLVSAVGKVVAPVDLTGKSADFTADARLVPVNQQGKEIEGLTIYPEKTQVSVSLTPIAKKMLDVKLVTQGTLPDGLVIKGIVAQPEKVEVSETAAGKDSSKVEVVYTEPVSLTDIRQDTTREVRLLLPEGLTVTPATIKVTIKVGPR